MECIEVIKARKSVRHYEAGFVISEAEIRQMLEEALLAPSGNNLQPWRMVVVRDQVVKEQLQAAAFGQKQVAEASFVVAFFAKKDAYLAARDIYDLAVQAGYMTPEASEQGLEHLLTFYGNIDEAIIERNVVLDTSLLAMQMMLVVKDHGYDSVAMGGFKHAEVSKILQMDENHIPLLLLPVGKAAKAAHDTVRLSVDAVTKFI